MRGRELECDIIWKLRSSEAEKEHRHDDPRKCEAHQTRRSRILGLRRVQPSNTVGNRHREEGNPRKEAQNDDGHVIPKRPGLILDDAGVTADGVLTNELLKRKEVIVQHQGDRPRGSDRKKARSPTTQARADGAYVGSKRRFQKKNGTTTNSATTGATSPFAKNPNPAAIQPRTAYRSRPLSRPRNHQKIVIATVRSSSASMIASRPITACIKHVERMTAA